MFALKLAPRSSSHDLSGHSSMVYKDGIGKRQDRANEGAEPIEASTRCSKRPKQRVRFFWGPFAGADAADQELSVAEVNTRTRSISQQQQEYDHYDSSSGDHHSETHSDPDKHDTYDPASIADLPQPLLCGSHNCARAEFVNPLDTFIRLSASATVRRATLLALKQPKLRTADRFLRSYNRHLDLRKHYFTEKRCETSDGAYCCTRFHVQQFENVESVRQVFDALLRSMFSLEISISEQLGEITLREDHDESLEVDGVCNYRMIARATHGDASKETNCVTFAQFFDQPHDAAISEPGYGVMVTDFVDVDDLHPYRPNQYVRRDVSATMVLTPHRQRSEVGKDKLVVALQHAVFEKLHQPELAIERPELHALYRGMNRWGDVIIKAIRDRLAAGMG